MNNKFTFKISIKAVAILTAAFVFFLCVSSAGAYILPKYKILEEDMHQPAEAVLEKYTSRLESLCSASCRSDLSAYEKKSKKRLAPAQMRVLKNYRSLKVDITFWEYVTSLKRELSGLVVGGKCASEADFMAKQVVQRIYDISQTYKVGSSPLIQNWMINQGMKKRGHCYHYVTDIRDSIRNYDWKCFDLRWGVANDKELDEHNVLVITARGESFETGLLIDAWRNGSKPVWIKVTSDKDYKWFEAPNLEYE